jgi:hypothetical protein
MLAGRRYLTWTVGASVPQPGAGVSVPPAAATACQRHHGRTSASPSASSDSSAPLGGSSCARAMKAWPSSPHGREVEPSTWRRANSALERRSRSAQRCWRSPVACHASSAADAADASVTGTTLPPQPPAVLAWFPPPNAFGCPTKGLYAMRTPNRPDFAAIRAQLRAAVGGSDGRAGGRRGRNGAPCSLCLCSQPLAGCWLLAVAGWAAGLLGCCRALGGN